MNHRNNQNQNNSDEFAFARETTISIPKRPKTTNVFAVCLETDDEKLLIPMKIYEIGLRGNKARVIDEAGEPTIYPLDYFLVLSLPEKAMNLIEQTYTMKSKTRETVSVL